MRARWVVMANGPLNRPKLPGIAGIDTYKGHTFHTSRWDYAYTGGSRRERLTGLADKRVGVIGTGATAVQCVPHLGAAAQALYVFQRHAVLHRRARQPADGSRLGGRAWPGMAEGTHGELQYPDQRWDCRAGPGAGRLDRDHP